MLFGRTQRPVMSLRTNLSQRCSLACSSQSLSVGLFLELNISHCLYVGRQLRHGVHCEGIYNGGLEVVVP